MRANLSIAARLWATVAVLGVLLVLTGLLGQYGMKRSNEELDHAYSNQLAASIASGRANLDLTVARLALDRALLHPESPDVPDLIGRTRRHITDSDRAWHDYSLIAHEPDEQVLADRVAAARTALKQKGILPLIDALTRGDQAAIDDIAMKKMSPMSLALTSSADALDAWQNKNGKETFTRAERLYRHLSVAGAALVVLGLIVCAVCAWGLHRAIAVPLGKVLEVLQRIAAGDLSMSLVSHSHDEMGHLVDGLKTMQGSLATTVRQVTLSAETIATATRQIAAGNNDLSQRTEEQAASLQETAASMEEFTATVKQNADNARTAQTLADNANEVVGRGAQVVGDVVQTMDEIDRSSQKIADITGVIEGIAFQTNILALNAAVEAARAGDEGRGFAVVAGEVRSLAQRAGTAAKEIKALIGDSVERVESGARLVRTAGETMDEIRGSIARVTTIIKEIALASDEQRDGIEQVSLAVSQMDQVSQQNAALVEEAAAAAASLDDQATVLRNAVAVFRLE
jgi:methyl-accepting chemotaxis protein